MSNSVKILMVEHNPDDIELILYELKALGMDFVSEIVQNEERYRAAIENFIPDVILSDYSLPSFDGTEAFKIREAIAPNIPFIFVSGSIGEEKSIEYIKNGVTDYVLKDKLFTLNVKVKRALKEAKEKKEKNKTEQELVRSESMLARAQQIAKLGSWELNFSDNMFRLSNEGCRVFEIPADHCRLSFESWLSMVHPDDMDRVLQTVKISRDQLEDLFYEYRIVVKDGTTRHIISESKFEFDEYGNAIGLFGTMQDITERKKSEEAVRKAYEEKNMVLERIDDGFFAIDENSLVTYWNKRAEILLAEKKEDVLGKNLHEIFAETGSPVFYNHYQKAIRENTTIHFEEFSKRTGKWFAVSAYASENGLSVYFKDVTERRNSENKIKESELRYRSLNEQATDAICITDASLKFIDINPYACETFGYSRAEALQLFLHDILFPEDLAENPLKEAELRSGKTVKNERRLKKKDGTAIHMDVSTKMMEDGGLIMFGHDITTRMEGEKKNKFRAKLLNTIGQAVIATDLDGNVNFWNKAAEDMYGWTYREAKGKNIIDLTPTQQTQEQAGSIMKELSKGHSWSGEFIAQRRNGQEFPIYVTNSPIYDQYNKPSGIIGVSTDITERKKNELRLIVNEHQLDVIYNTVADIIFMLSVEDNEQYKFISVNHTFLETTGLKNSDVIDRLAADVIPGPSWEIAKLKYNEAVKTKTTQQWEEISEYASGIKTGLVSITPVLDNEGNCIRLVGSVHDVTEQKNAIAQIKNSEQRYRTLFEQNLTGIYQTTVEGTILNCNDAFAKMLKYSSSAEIMKINAFDLYFSRKDRDDFVKDLKGQKKLSNYEAILKCKDGSRLHVIENNSLRTDEVTGEEFCDGVMINISERKKAEQEMSWLINNTEESFILLNSKLTITSFNNRARELYAKYFIKKLVKGRRILDYSQPERLSVVKKIYERVLKGSEENDEIVIPLPDASIKYFAIKYKPAKDEDGQIIGAFVSAIDITEQKKAQARQEFERRDKEALINTTTDLIWSVSSDFKLIAANQAFINSMQEFTGRTLIAGSELLHKETFTPEYNEFWQSLYIKVLDEGKPFTKEIHTPGGKHYPEHWSETSFHPILDGNVITGIACYSRDTTASKHTQNKIIEINKKLETAQQIAQLGYWELDMDIKTLFWSDEVYNIWEVTPGSFKLNFQNYYKTIHPEDRKLFDNAQRNALVGKEKMDIEHRIILASGKMKFVHEKGELVYNDKGKAVRFEGTVQDITERKELENLLNKASKLAQIGSWEVDLIKNTLFWSPITKEIHETEPGFIPDLETAINFYKEGESRNLIYQKLEEAIQKNMPWDIELQIITAKGNEKWTRSIGETQFTNGKVVRINGSFQDITERKIAEIRLNELNEELKKHAKELAISNAELEQFAYVASHDLQEPLRMVTSFLTQLEKKYGAVIDAKGKQYIAFAVDGAKRMRQIILDLLEFSRVGRTEDSKEKINLNELVEEIKILFRKQISEKNAVIKIVPLPIIYGHRVPLHQVFQNLISNALKYSSEDIPTRVQISSEEFQTHWQFTVSDNGIGIGKEYFDKIFIIFQRLHNKDEFSGTGMGLAITKKIIENQGGKIWVESKEAEGSTFYFTVLK